MSYVKPANLRRSFILIFSSTLSLLSDKIWYTKPSFLFKEACIGVKIVEECFLLLYCFVIVGNTTIHLPYFLSKTGFFSRCVIVRLNLSALKAPNDVRVKNLSIVLLFKKTIKVLFINSFCTLCFIWIWRFFWTWKYIFKRTFVIWALLLLKERSTQIYCTCR